MAKDIEKEKEALLEEKKEQKKLSKEEKAEKKLADKKEKAEKRKTEIVAEVRDIKAQIAEETDEKKKNKLRKKRDDLIAQRDAIIRSKDGATIPMSPMLKKRIKACVAVVVVIALIFGYLQTGLARYGLLSALSVPQKTVTGMVLTDGDNNKHSIKVNTYNYYFAMIYNNLQQMQSQYAQYGMDEDQKIDFDKKLSKQTTTDPDDENKKITWLEYIHNQVLDTVKTNYMYYYEALKANNGKEPDITDEQKKELKETIDNYKSTAEGYDFTVSGYLTAAMGKGVTEEVFRKEAKIQYIAENYQKEYEKQLSSKEYDKKDYNKYKKEHKDELVSVDIKYFEADSEDDAKAFKKALKADGSNFAELASKYAKDKWDKQANKNPVETTYKNITKSTLQGMNGAIAQADAHEHKEGEEEEHTYSGLDWIYSSKRKAGDIKQQSTSIVYIIKPVNLSDVHPVTVRHILIKPYKVEKGDDGKKTETDAETPSKASDKEWKNAKNKADKILAEYKKGKKTAESFGELAKDNSKDSNASDGGIYENVTPNQMVPTFNAWCFDSSRKKGDTAIVKTEFGYHIMYFESTSDLTVWQYTAQQALAGDDGSKSKEKLEKSYTIKETWFGSRFFEIDTDIDS